MKYFIFLVLILTLVSCQTIDSKPTKSCGGYIQIDKKEYSKKIHEYSDLLRSIELVKKAICEKIDTQTCEFKIERIEQQIVAGINYKITIEVNYTNKEGQKQNTSYEGIVWCKLDHTQELTDLTEKVNLTAKMIFFARN